MATTVRTGFVLGSDGKIYAQIPADNQFGFSICDEDQSWAGGVGSGLQSWTLLPNEDPRITEDDRERIGWMLDEVSDANTKTITVTWEEIDGIGRLIARCDEDSTLSSSVVRWEDPITATSDSHAIAEAVTRINGAEIHAVDHDGEFVHVHVFA